MKPAISVQLYSIKDKLTADYEKTIRAVHEMGFTCVETAGFPGTTMEKAKALFKELNISVPSCHRDLPLGENKNKVIEEVLSLGTKYIITGMPQTFRKAFISVDSIKETADLYNKAAEFVKPYGIQVGYHNHDFEMAELDGKPAYKYFLENTTDDVLWEADIFWVAFGGRDPVEFVKEIGRRGKAIHFKDGTLAKKAVFQEAETVSGKILVSNEKPFLPAGTGDIDLKGVAAASSFVEYAVVEIDSYNGDIMKAIKQSYDYITQSGIATGRI